MWWKSQNISITFCQVQEIDLKKKKHKKTLHLTHPFVMDGKPLIHLKYKQICRQNNSLGKGRKYFEGSERPKRDLRLT